MTHSNVRQKCGKKKNNNNLLVDTFLNARRRSKCPRSLFLKGDVKNVPFGAEKMLKGAAVLTRKAVGGPGGLGRGNLIPTISVAGGRCTLSREDTTKWGRQCYSDVVDKSVRTAGSSLKGITRTIPPSACGHLTSSMMSSLGRQY